MSADVTAAELHDCVCEFLEVAVHSILYYRNVYPRAFFVMTRKYAVPTPMSRSALVCEYVSKCIAQVKETIVCGIFDFLVFVLIVKTV